MKYKIICLQGAGFSSWDKPHTIKDIKDKFMDYASNEFDEMPPKKWFTLNNIAEVWGVEFERVKR